MRLSTLCFLLTSATLVAGCRDDLLTAPAAGDALIVAAASSGARHSTSPVMFFTGGPVGEAWSKITRNANGATSTLHTNALVPGNVYSMWVVVFNNPAGCIGACDEPDLFEPAAVVDVLWVSGGVAGGTGGATFAGTRREGDNSGSLFAQLGLPAPGLIDADAAELHLIVRDHGPLVPGAQRGQMATFEGQCTAASSFGLGTGSYDCADVQFSVHTP